MLAIFIINTIHNIQIDVFFLMISESLFFFFFWLYSVTCRILVPLPEIEPSPPAVEAQSPNHWTARKVPEFPFT